MLFAALCLFLLASSALGQSTAPTKNINENDLDYEEEDDGGYIFGMPKNGKLVHDMRKFGNMTIDWSPSRYPDFTKKNISIPLCHEWRIRRSFYEYKLPELTRNHLAMEQHMEKGTLVYPLIITGVRAESQQGFVNSFDLYVAAIHRVGRDEESAPLIEIIPISKKTWTTIWDRWATAPKKNSTKEADAKDDMKYPRASQTGEHSTNGSGFCDGGKHFDDILPKIYRDAKFRRHIETDINFLPVDLTSDVCNSTYCGCPKGPKETITSSSETYPEGKLELYTSPYFKDLAHYNSTHNNTDIDNFDPDYLKEVAEKVRTDTFVQMSRFIRACYDREMFARMKFMGKEYKEDELTDAQIKTNQAIFYEPYI